MEVRFEWLNETHFFSKQQSCRYCCMDALHGCLLNVWKKKLDSNYTRMLRAILNKPWKQHPTHKQLCSHLLPITKTIQIRQTRHAGPCWRSRDEYISDILHWTPSHGRAKAGRPARIYIQQLCADTGCSLEDVPGAMDDRDGWRKRVREIRADGVTSWWWWWLTELWGKSRCRSIKESQGRTSNASTHTHIHTHTLSEYMGYRK